MSKTKEYPVSEVSELVRDLNRDHKAELKRARRQSSVHNAGKAVTVAAIRHEAAQCVKEEVGNLRRDLKGKTIKAKGTPLIAYGPSGRGNNPFDDHTSRCRPSDIPDYETRVPHQLPKGNMSVLAVRNIDDFPPAHYDPWTTYSDLELAEKRVLSRLDAESERLDKSSRLGASSTLMPVLELVQGEDHYFALATDISKLRIVA
jgi:hypothetical protein